MRLFASSHYRMSVVWSLLAILLSYPTPDNQAFALVNAQDASQVQDRRVDDRHVSEVNEYEDAIVLATQQHKYLLVAVYEKGCPDCLKLDTDVFKDPEFVKWAADKANILRLYREDPIGRNFSIAHAIEQIPTVLIMANDGRELGREVGFQKAHRFLRRINIAIQSRKIATKGDAVWAGQDVVLSIMRKAGRLASEGQHEAAFEEYLWCINHRATHAPMFSATYLQDLIDGIAALGEEYAPATEELRKRYDEARRVTLQEKYADIYALYMLRYGAEALGEPEALVPHYDRMKGYWPDSVQVSLLSRLIFEPLLKARRYAEIAYSVERPEDVDLYLEESRSMKRDLTEMCKVLGSRYEVLLGLGRDREARELAAKFSRHYNDVKVYTALATASLHSGQAIRDNVLYARKAFVLQKGRDADATILLALMLTKLDPNDEEAPRILKSAMRRSKDATEAAKLGDVLRAIEKKVRDGK